MNKPILLFCTILLVASAAQARKPYLDLDAEKTFDGLYPVKKTVMGDAWARDDLDLSDYDKIMLVSTGLHYRPVKPMTGRSSMARRNRDFFPLDEKQKARLQKVVQEEFTKEFAKLDRFAVVDAPGPGVLLLRGGIYDIVSRVPPEPIGRTEFYLSSLGGAAIVLELVDSPSNVVIVRAVDARSIDQRGIVMESNPVTNAAQARTYVRQWARWVRRSLEQVIAVDEEGKVVRDKD